MRSREELKKVLLFMLAAFLGNAFFVIGRNVGTVLFLAHLGKDFLTSAIFISGVASVFVGQIFSSASKGRSAALVNSWLLGWGCVIIGAFYVAALMAPSDLPEHGPERIFIMLLFLGVYIAEDVFTMFVAMQCASVAQAAFSVADAKRLFGLVQLGNSIAAMTIGICIGSIAVAVGTEQLLAIQSALLLLSLFINMIISRLYIEPGAGTSAKKKRKAIAAGGAAVSEPWWKNFLVLAMGLWGFTVIFTKTMYEYEYNVLVAGKLSPTEMVTLTGYLYAGAGFASTAINLVGTQVCLEKLGMQGAILATPAALLSVSVAILLRPSISTTFAGRLVDLSLRWSLNNTVRTVLWIAVPPQQAAAAKPWVEGTIKKMGQAFNAVVITVMLHISGGNLASLSFLSLAFCSILFMCCIRVYSLYLNSMWTRIKRRELRHHDCEELPFDANIDRQVMERLRDGGSAAQIAILNQVAAGLSAAYWEDFFAHFYSFPAAVQVKILELSRKQPHRVSDEFVLELLDQRHQEPSVLQLAVLVAGDRKLYSSLEYLQGLLGHPRPALRAAAAVSIINIGWGVGLGSISFAALLVLETMLDQPLEGSVQIDSRQGCLRAAQAILHSRGYDFGESEELTPEKLQEQAEILKQEWDSAIVDHKLGQACVLAIQATQVQSAYCILSRPELECLSPRQRKPSNDFVEKLPPKGADSGTSERWEDMAAALQMLTNLQDPRALMSQEAWAEFLVHDSAKVRLAAIAWVREDEDAQPLPLGTPSILQRLIKNLQNTETYAAAESAIFKLKFQAQVQEAVLEELKYRFDRHKDLASARTGALLDQASAYARTCVNMMNLLKFLQRQTRVSSATELQSMRASAACNTLLDFTSEILDADVLQELYVTMVDLKDRGLQVARQQVEARIYQVAKKLCQGFVVQQWMQHRCTSFSSEQLNLLRTHFELPAAANGGTWFGAGPSGGKGINYFTDDELVSTVVKIGRGYASEHLYLQRLQLLHLAILIAPPLPASYRSTRVLAAWRVLRSGDAASEAAVLEVLDSMLPVALKGIVLPLLDSSPLDKKLGVSAAIPGGDVVSQVDWKTSSRPPPWADEWFHGTFSVFGAHFFAMLSRVAEVRKGMAPAAQKPEIALLPKVFLLARVNLYAGLLSIHLADMALITTIKRCPQGKLKCEQGVTYVIAEGSFAIPHTGQTLNEGDVIQELHSICRELPVTEAECTSPGGGAVLCISWKQLFELMVRLTPKFALGILRNLVRVLPAPTTKGGSRMARGSANFGFRARIGTAIALDDQPSKTPKSGAKEGEETRRSALSDEDIAELAIMHAEDEREPEAESAEGDEKGYGHAEGQVEQDKPGSHGEEGLLTADRKLDTTKQKSFSLLEKLVLLQEVKMFRYVPMEYLPDIAKACMAVFHEKGEVICKEGEPANATLYIVAEGVLGLHTLEGAEVGIVCSAGLSRSESGALVRTLYASDTMGNTALLHDSQWQYSAVALEDTWLLCMDRVSLTDVLRGRRELASAVIHGLYKTFTRRIKNAVFKDLPQQVDPDDA